MQPIVGGPNVHVIGGIKSADEIPALTPVEIQAVFSQTDDLFKNGDVDRILAMPALSTPIREIVRLATALRKYHDFAVKVAKLEEDGLVRPSDLAPLIEQAKTLTGADVPPPSRLILPG
jgi:hypothetical protein